MKKVFKGIGVAANRTLNVDAVLSLILGILSFIIVNNRRSNSYSETDQIVGFFIELVPFFIIGLALYFLAFRINCAKNTIVITDNIVSVEYINPMTFTTVQKKSEFSVSSINSIFVERRGAFQYINISTTGESHKIAIGDPEGVKNAILYLKNNKKDRFI